MENQFNKPYWFLITIDDANFLSGKSIYDVIQHILKTIDFKFVILDYIYGALTAPLAENENKVLDISDLLKQLLDVEQFDWGDFFLFKEYPYNWSNPEGELYPFVVSQSDTTIRAVDDQYIYIYTPYKEIVNIIKNHYVIEEIKKGSLDSLDYPE